MLNYLAGGYLRFPSQRVFTFDRFNLIALPLVGCIMLLFFGSSSHIHWGLDVSFMLGDAERLVNRWILRIKASFWDFSALWIQKCALDIKRLIFRESILHLHSLCSSFSGFFFDWGIQKETNWQFWFIKGLSSHNVSCVYLSVVQKTFWDLNLMVWGLYIIWGRRFNCDVVFWTSILVQRWRGTNW